MYFPVCPSLFIANYHRQSSINQPTRHQLSTSISFEFLFSSLFGWILRLGCGCDWILHVTAVINGFKEATN
uniref:Uncharacterized protein n=1 Tax=Anopheles atroparvus TaxID=41427 RepID=A0AAG5DX51_ANOAO